MKKTLKERRIKAVKSKFAIFPVECRSCKSSIKFEKVWRVQRWGVNKTIHDWHYCKDCMPTPEDVINEIDTDNCCFGIAFVDSYII